MNKYKLSCLQNIKIDDIFSEEYPKFESAYISYAENKRGVPLTDEELEWINYESDEHEKYYNLIYQEYCNFGTTFDLWWVSATNKPAKHCVIINL